MKPQRTFPPQLDTHNVPKTKDSSFRQPTGDHGRHERTGRQAETSIGHSITGDELKHRSKAIFITTSRLPLLLRFCSMLASNFPQDHLQNHSIQSTPVTKRSLSVEDACCYQRFVLVSLGPSWRGPARGPRNVSQRSFPSYIALHSRLVGNSLKVASFSAPARAACSTASVTVTVGAPEAKSSTEPRLAPTATVTIDSFGVPIHGPPEAKSSTKPRISPTATVTIDSFGVPMHGPDDDEEKTSSRAPPGHCSPAPPKEPTPTPQTHKACHKPGNAKTETPVEKTSTSSAKKCAQVSGGPEAQSTASFKSEASGPVLTTGGPSSSVSSAQLVSETPSHSLSPSNITSGSGLPSTGTASGSGVLPSSVVSPTGASASYPGFNSSTSPIQSLTGASASYTAGPIHASGTGTSDVSWQAGTSVSGPRNSSRTVSSPSSFTPSGVTRGPMGSLPSSWGSTSQVDSPPGLTPTGLTHSGEIPGPTGSTPGNNRNSSQTVSASSAFAPSGSMASTVTGNPAVSISSNSSSSATVSAPSSVSPSGPMTSSVTGKPAVSTSSSSSSSPTVGSPSGFIPSSDIVSSTSRPSNSRVASETAPTPSGVISSANPIVPAGQISPAPLESPPGESSPGKDVAASETSSFLSIPSPFTPARDTRSSQGAAESASPAGGDNPSFPYNPPIRPIRKRTIPPFTQQGDVRDLLSGFGFLEDTNGLDKQRRQPAQEAAISDPTPTSTGYGTHPVSDFFYQD